MKYFAVEAQYNHLGNIGDPGGNNHSVTGYSLVAVGIYPFNEEWSGFAKLGYASTSIAITPTDSKKSAATYGIGGQYNINQALGVRVGYDMYSIGGDAPVFNNNTKTGVVSVGVVYKF
jgi:opacity protein-like surface antigen